MPIVTVSRMFASGGSEVAALIARQLGFTLLDDALVETVAERLGSTRADVEARSESAPTLSQRLAEALALGSQELVPWTGEHAIPPSEERILEMTRHVVAEAASRGSVVLVGRGAQLMLASRVDAVHVLCYAPFVSLVERAMRREGLDAPAAERLVAETNQRREQYIRRYWKRSWLGHENYHLCVNTAWLGIAESAALAVTVARDRLRLGTTG